jgi:uncharacterized peroxidase-related enzyme
MMGSMAYIEPAPPGTETDRLLDGDAAIHGFVPNFTRYMAWRPEAYRAWQRLNGAIKEGMDLRRYELATMAAARRLGSSYCLLAHGRALRDRHGMPADQLRDTVVDHHEAGLDPVDVAIMDFADKVVGNASRIRPEDVQALRDVGLSDEDIVDVALAIGARCFFSTVVESLGVRPDAQYREIFDADVQDALTVGRPIADA